MPMRALAVVEMSFGQMSFGGLSWPPVEVRGNVKHSHLFQFNVHLIFSRNSLKLYLQNQIAKLLVYDNEYASIINTYFYEFFLPFKPRALALQNI